jgi:hypothetical protein
VKGPRTGKSVVGIELKGFQIMVWIVSSGRIGRASGGYGIGEVDCKICGDDGTRGDDGIRGDDGDGGDGRTGWDDGSGGDGRTGWDDEERGG